MIEIEADADIGCYARHLRSIDENCARIMRFKKVHWFMGKLCVQVEGDVANNNIPWSPTTNINDAMHIMAKYRLSIKPRGASDWCCYSEHTEAHSSNMLLAICKSLIAHERLG